VETIYHNCLSGQQQYTCGPLADANALSSENPEFKFQAEGKSILISLCHFQITILVTALPPLSLTYNLLQATERTEFWRIQCIQNKSSYSLQMWTACYSVGTNVRISKGKGSRNFMGIYSETIIKLRLCNCLKPSQFPKMWTGNLAHEKAKTNLKTKAKIMHVLTNKQVCKQPMYLNCASLCSQCEGREEEKTTDISLFPMNYRN